MRAVILAAGRGERLNGIAAPYHKPLLPVNGKPLITNAVELAQRLTDGAPIVVVAPENALPIAQVLEEHQVHMIIQPKPTGPGAALKIGMQLVPEQDEYTLVLMGDNVLAFDDVHRVSYASGPAVGVQLLQRDEAERFTRQRRAGDWVEKVPITEDDVDPHSGMVLCWVGPLKVPAATARTIDDAAVGPNLLNRDSYESIDVSTYDIGVPEAWA